VNHLSAVLLTVLLVPLSVEGGVIRDIPNPRVVIVSSEVTTGEIRKEKRRVIISSGN